MTTDALRRRGGGAVGSPPQPAATSSSKPFFRPPLSPPSARPAPHTTRDPGRPKASHRKHARHEEGLAAALAADGVPGAVAALCGGVVCLNNVAHALAQHGVRIRGPPRVEQLLRPVCGG